jgi:hypothetical protein
MIFLFILVFFSLLAVEVPKITKDQDWAGLKVYSVFMLLAFILCILQLIGVKLPSPVKGIVFLVRDLLHLNYT